MKGFRVKLAAAVTAAGVLATGTAAVATGGGESGGSFRASLDSFQEVPALSSPGARGSLRVWREGERFAFDLRYSGLEGDVLFAHVHLGQRAVNGGVSVFLCGAPGGEACPAPPARVRGSFGTADVVGPESQGIAPGELEELVRAMRAGVTYANVHTSVWPAGNIRGQIHRR
jgi:ABC-type amino acid transport substrate-binding protein